ncbi:hypothetical protein AA313_de0200073 [Arthrobotrys entomopaga]|nr:hypothetical protein AA313_de0200073 [Arthrobotrys entomopaga]
MHFSTLSLSAVLTALATAPYADAHSFIYHARGNVKGTGVGWALGYHNVPTTKDHKLFEVQLPYQRVTAVFSNPAVPCYKSANRQSCEKRAYLNTGCGISLFSIEEYEKKSPDKYKPWGKSTNRKNAWYFMGKYSSPKAFIDTSSEVNRILKAKALPRVTPGGTLKMILHQVNADGAGPYRCRIDYTGLGKRWSKWIPVTKNAPGSGSYYSAGAGKNFDLIVRIPKNAKCTGTYGKAKNICMVRCENKAANGPFGGCVPVQLIQKAKLKPKPKPKPKPKTKPAPKPKPKPKPKPIPVRPPKVIQTKKVVVQTSVVYETKQNNVVVTNTQVVTNTEAVTVTLTDSTAVTETNTVVETDQQVPTGTDQQAPTGTDQVPTGTDQQVPTETPNESNLTQIQTTAPPPTGTSEPPPPVFTSNPAYPVDYSDNSTVTENPDTPPSFPNSDNDPSMDTAPVSQSDAEDNDGDATNPGDITPDDSYY